MDNASDYGSEDCRFDSCLARSSFFFPHPEADLSPCFSSCGHAVQLQSGACPRAARRGRIQLLRYAQTAPDLPGRSDNKTGIRHRETKGEMAKKSYKGTMELTQEQRQDQHLKEHPEKCIPKTR
ncbi:hypothetical protein Y1Q_0003787 [Alligator mississippiensis]|uniref:Uncharacterized protein n=1 Tax=Alligator mississippiensis TaxID=8496 RepID=A0A151MNM2_ALLMI|nr:hypothetical protein Y1Q_0003787 [Alligator mississippiensis]